MLEAIAARSTSCLGKTPCESVCRSRPGSASMVRCLAIRNLLSLTGTIPHISRAIMGLVRVGHLVIVGAYHQFAQSCVSNQKTQQLHP